MKVGGAMPLYGFAGSLSIKRLSWMIQEQSHLKQSPGERKKYEAFRAGIRYFFGTGGIGIRYLKTGHSVSVFRYLSKTGHSVSVFR